MAIYYRGSGLSWDQYLQANSFVGDVTNSIRRNSQDIKTAISDQAMDIIASNESLAQSIEYGLEDISGEIAELRSAFNYNMGLMLEQLRIQQQTLNGILNKLDAIHETILSVILCYIFGDLNRTYLNMFLV
jgi:hypothetical protein